MNWEKDVDSAWRKSDKWQDAEKKGNNKKYQNQQNCVNGMNDPVNNPLHYRGKGMTVIDVIRAFDLGFELGNAIKYILRCEHKGTKKEDLLKAIKNIEFENEKD